jgi:hypothetical protein
MAAMLFRVVEAAFAVTWITLGILTFIVFTLPRDVALKRKWLPRFVISAGVLFVLFSTTLEVLRFQSWSALSGLYIVVPGVWLIGYWNIKMSRFCDECSAPLSPSDFLNWLVRQKPSSKCGRKPNIAKPVQIDDLSDDALQ